MSESVGSSDEQRGKRNLGELIPLALAFATAGWMSAIVISPLPNDGAPFSVSVRIIAAQLGTPLMGLLVLGTVLACLYVPSNGSSPGSLLTRRAAAAIGAFASVCAIAGALWTVWKTAIDVHVRGAGPNDSLSVSFSRGGPRVGERISVTLYCLAAVVLSSLALALAAQLLRRHNTGGGDNETTRASPDRSTE